MATIQQVTDWAQAIVNAGRMDPGTAQTHITQAATNPTGYDVGGMVEQLQMLSIPIPPNLSSGYTRPGLGAGLAGAGAGLAAVTPTPTPTTTGDISEYLSDPELMQALYEKLMGIPTAGRSRYQSWLANQWQVPASEYALLSAGLMGTPTPTAATPPTFEQFMRGRAGQPVSQMGGRYLTALGLMEPTAQRTMLENLPGYVAPEALYGGLRSKYPAFIAAGLQGQAMGAPSTRGYEISPEGIAGGSFLNYLRQQYKL